jgi:hypothetical protein
MAEATADVAAGERVQWQGDYTRGRHRDGEPGQMTTRLAVIFVHFSNNTRRTNRTAGGALRPSYCGWYAAFR